MILARGGELRLPRRHLRHGRRLCRNIARENDMSGLLKLLGGAAGIIFLIGLLVVIGLFALIF
jgi:hypothetical protein